ncbi:MAG: TadE/TadG family type IV pilus assembly protein [Chloroflexota bacterium]
MKDGLALTAATRRTRGPLGASRAGQAMVQFALLITVLFGLVGGAVDYGVLLIENQKLKNATDAASLAGARSLFSGASPGTTQATSTATTYLTNHGYTNGGGTAVAISYWNTTTNSSCTTTCDQITVQVTKTTPSLFWKVIGINNFNVNAQSKAVAAGGLVDVMLVVDTTNSMNTVYGTVNGMVELRQAAKDFVNQMSPSASLPYGPKVGMAWFQGTTCTWFKKNSDLVVDEWNGEYTTPCGEHSGVLQSLSFSKDTLVKIADNSGAGTCPTFTGFNTGHGCPLNYRDGPPLPAVTGTQSATAVPTGVRNSSGGSVQAFGGTGTRLPNAMKVISGCSTVSGACTVTGGSPTYHAWSTAQGGRNDAATVGMAKKILVMMTDGINNATNLPSSPAATAIPFTYLNTSGTPTTGSATNSSYDNEVQGLAARLKKGPDNVSGTEDDVEIYVVGFLCTPTMDPGNTDCASNIVNAGTPYKCPGATWPTTSPAPSGIDSVLRNVSSSTSGTCDHYFPISKTDDLPQLFKVIAGAIARGKLTE